MHHLLQVEMSISVGKFFDSSSISLIQTHFVHGTEMIQAGRAPFYTIPNLINSRALLPKFLDFPQSKEDHSIIAAACIYTIILHISRNTLIFFSLLWSFMSLLHWSIVLFLLENDHSTYSSKTVELLMRSA